MNPFSELTLKCRTTNGAITRPSQADLLRVAWVGFGPLLGDGILGRCRLREVQGHAKKRAASSALLAGMSQAHASILRRDPGLVESF